MTDLALLLLRVVTGGLLMGHGAQKLFGSFGGPALTGRPVAGVARAAAGASSGPARLASGSLVGGLLTVLGPGRADRLDPDDLVDEDGDLQGAFRQADLGHRRWCRATGRQHRREHGRYADRAGPLLAGSPVRVKVPRWLTALVLLGSSATLVVGLLMEPETPAQAAE